MDRRTVFQKQVDEAVEQFQADLRALLYVWAREEWDHVNEQALDELREILARES